MGWADQTQSFDRIYSSMKVVPPVFAEYSVIRPQRRALSGREYVGHGIHPPSMPC